MRALMFHKETLLNSAELKMTVRDGYPEEWKLKKSGREVCSSIPSWATVKMQSRAKETQDTSHVPKWAPFLSEYKNPLVNMCEGHLCVRSDGEMQSHGIKNFFSACVIRFSVCNYK